MLASILCTSKIFLSTLSLRRATGPRWIKCRHPRFLSTLSLRRATHRRIWCLPHCAISIHALLAESDGFHKINCQLMVISIHALLAESDRRSSKTIRRFPYFYPRSPCGERLRNSPALLGNSQFLSTLSLRRATGFGLARLVARINFYPRSPCGERPVCSS